MSANGSRPWSDGTTSLNSEVGRGSLAYASPPSSALEDGRKCTSCRSVQFQRSNTALSASSARDRSPEMRENRTNVGTSACAAGEVDDAHVQAFVLEVAQLLGDGQRDLADEERDHRRSDGERDPHAPQMRPQHRVGHHHAVVVVVRVFVGGPQSDAGARGGAARAAGPRFGPRAQDSATTRAKSVALTMPTGSRCRHTTTRRTRRSATCAATRCSFISAGRQITAGS